MAPDAKFTLQSWWPDPQPAEGNEELVFTSTSLGAEIKLTAPCTTDNYLWGVNES